MGVVGIWQRKVWMLVLVWVWLLERSDVRGSSHLQRLLCMSARWTGRRLLELFVLWPLRVCMLLLERVELLVRGVVSAGRHLLELLVRGTRWTGRRLLELFVFWPLRVCWLPPERVGLLLALTLISVPQRLLRISPAVLCLK